MVDASYRNAENQLPNDKKDARISARVPYKVKETIDIAAQLSGATTNQFMAQAAYQAAHRLIEQERITQLTAEDTLRLLNILDNPPQPTIKLKKAVSAYKNAIVHADN